MHGWMLSLGCEASNFNQGHVDAFRRHLSYLLCLNRPKSSNAQMAKVKVEDEEVIVPEDGVASKASSAHDKIGAVKKFKSMKDIPRGHQLIQKDLTGYFWALQTGPVETATSKNSFDDLSKDDSETNDAILKTHHCQLNYLHLPKS